MKKDWLIGPFVFFAFLAALLVIWAVTDPAVLIRNFDQGGYSPFELVTLPFFAALVPLVWWKCPFGGTHARRTLLCAAVTLVAVMAVAKELDLHIAALRFFYPEIVTPEGGMAPGFYKPNGTPLVGTPFKMRVLTNGAVPLGMKVLILFYFTAFFGVFCAGLVYLLPTWIKGVLKLDPAAWAFGCCGGSGVIVQIADRLPSWLDHAHGLTKGNEATAAASLCTCLEEGCEMLLAVMALLTIVLAARTRRLLGQAR